MYKFLTALLVSLMSLVAFADGHGNHGDKKSEKKASNPSQIKYEDPTKYYPKK